MKILVLQDYLRSGGTERQSVLLANAFSAAGHETSLVTFRPGGALDRTVGAEVQRRSLQRSDYKLDWFAPGLRGTVRSLNPAVILCMGRMANCYGGLLQQNYPRTAVLATMRTGKRLPLLFRRSLKAVTHVVANSFDAKAILTRDYRIPIDRISVIHNSLVFPASSAAKPDLALRATHGAVGTTTVLLNVAMFRPEKNQRELIEIAATLPDSLDWQLWLAGDGPTRADCEELSARLKLNSRVRFLGLVRDPTSLYGAADIAIHASASESLSNFLIEAQASGLPAIAYSAQGITETFVPDRTGWEIARNDRAAFRNRIGQLAAESDSARKSRSQEAQAFARSTFDPENQVKRYLQLFSSVRP